MTTKQPFEEVVSAHGPTVLRVCRAQLGRADADDAWSETFLAALRAYPKLPTDANVEAWLVTIAQRKVIDLVRGAGRRGVPVAEVPPPAGDQGDAAGGASRDLDLARSLDRLPDKQRLAVVYHYLAGLPYSRVASILGGSVDAARRAAADGVAQLRRTEGTIKE